MRDAQVLLLDEPTASLDARSEFEQGSHEQLVALGARYAELFELQAAGYRLKRNFGGACRIQ